jgi:choice-of-anchor B domain-containing protein
MNALSRRIAAVSVCMLVLTGTAWAHSDDPKLRDLQPRYEGPGYRADLDDVVPVDFPAQGVTLKSWLPLSEFGSHSSAADCWGYVSESGREYAIIGLARGTGFVDITEPGNARIIGVISGPNNLWKDVQIYRNYCYAVSEGGSGIQVIDLSRIDEGIVTKVRDVTTGGTTATHTVIVNEDSGYLYRCGGDNNGLRIYDLSDPSNPTFVASWSTRYVHECQVVSYTDGPYAGREIVFAYSGYNGGWDQTGLEIIDVTNKQNIRSLNRSFWSQAGYSHQGWLTPDRRYVYVGDELDEQTYNKRTTTIVFDVQNIEAPSYVGTFTNNNTATGHNMYTRGSRLYQANYTSGLRVFDISNPTAPVETAWFDTYPSNDRNSFTGLWGCYPYFPSGTIIGSDMVSGLFVWRLEIACPGDLNGDARVDQSDLAILLAAFGSSADGDLDDDGDTDQADLALLLSYYGTECG